MGEPDKAAVRQRGALRPETEFGIGRLFDVVPDAVIVGEASTGQIVLWNPAAAAMFGYEPDAGPGLLIEDLVPEAMRSAHREGINRLARSEPTPLIDSESMVELSARRRDGSELWIELRLAHLAGPNRGRFALAVIRDITIRREADAARDKAIRELREVRLELERRNEELELISRTDHLTGLWNRRHVEESLEKALSASRRHDGQVSVLLLDVDEFKSVNTRFGHPVGDVALQEIAARLRDKVRTEDTLGRWGGEEFLVVLPDASVSEAFAAGERFRAAVGAEPVSAATAEIPVTISAGVACSRSGDKEGLLADADAALSRAKSAGRDRLST